VEAARAALAPRTPALRLAGLAAGARRVLAVLVCGVLPLILLASALRAAIRGDTFAYDFHYAGWQAGRDLLLGHGPYVGPDALSLSGPGSGTGAPPTWFVYPAPAALLFAPFAVFPLVPAEILYTLVCIAAVAGTLAVLGVRDWRVYGVAFLWPAVLAAVQTGNVTVFLVLGMAVAWRYRERPVVVGAAVGLVISLKIFVWPLALWLLATRRHAALGWAALSAVAVNLIAWAIVGFDQIPRFLDLLSGLASFEHGRTHSWTDFALRSGLGSSAARALVLAIAVAACVACVAAARRGHDALAFALCVLVTLAATPILWNHYYVLLLVPVAIARPRLSPLWALPIVAAGVGL